MSSLKVFFNLRQFSECDLLICADCGDGDVGCAPCNHALRTRYLSPEAALGEWLCERQRPTFIYNQTEGKNSILVSRKTYFGVYDI